MERPTKIMAISKQNYADVRFSDLPDEVVHHILFFLRMRDLARLSVVSKRCRVLCISNPNLFLSNIDKSGGSRFNSFVDRLMALRCLYGVKTELFLLRWSFEGSVEDEECRVGTWLQHAVNWGGVADVRLNVIHPRQPFALPLCLLGCNSLRFLKVEARNGFFKLPSAPYFATNLQNLLLESVRIEKDCNFGELFSSLKSLKVLRLNEISGIKSMNITSSSIEELLIRSADRDLCDIDIQQLDKLYELDLVWIAKSSSSRSLKISAPNLQMFHLEGFAVDYYCMRDSPHLLHATIDLRLPAGSKGNQASTKYNLDKVLHSVRMARRLNLRDCFVEIHQDCGFFEWIDPPLCEHGKRVISRLRQRHESLLAEAKRCETMVEVEVGKVRAKMEKEALQMKAGLANDIALYRMEINIGEIKLQAMKKNYQSIIVCS